MLIECMVYISMVMILVGLSLAAFYRAYGHSTRLHRFSNEIVRALNAGERWRAEVRSASAPMRVEEEEGRLVLIVPRAGGETAFAFFEEAVWRREGSDASWTPFLEGVQAARFEPVTRKRVRGWRWELELVRAHRQARTVPLFTFQAVPGWAEEGRR